MLLVIENTVATHLVGHEQDTLTLLDVTRLDLTDEDGTHVLVLFSDGEHEGRVQLAVERLHVVEILEQGGAAVEGALVGALLDVGTGEARDGHEVDIGLGVVAGLLQKGRHLGDDLVVAGLVPIDGRVIHLVDGHDDLVDTGGLGQHGVLTGLTTTLETSLEFTLTSRDDHDTDIGLGRTADHAGHIVLMARGIEDRVSALVGLEKSAAALDGLTLGTFLIVGIQGPGQVPRLTAGLLGFLFVLLHRTLVDHAGEVQDVTTHGGLAGI